MSPTRTELTRRDMLRRTAVAGLAAGPAAGLLSACALGSDDDPSNQSQGNTSATNPLGVDEQAALEVVIFNGGFGEDYAKAHEAVYRTSIRRRRSSTRPRRRSARPCSRGSSTAARLT